MTVSANLRYSDIQFIGIVTPTDTVSKIASLETEYKQVITTNN
jgi:hypothetical protein